MLPYPSRIYVLAAVALVLAPWSVTGQKRETTTGRRVWIRGWVRDETHASVGGATVTLNRAPGGKPLAVAHTSAYGVYELRAAPSTDYIVTFEAPGLAPFRERISVSLSDQYLSSVTLMIDRPCFPAPAPAPTSRSTQVIATTLCEIMKAPERFNGKLVRFRARVATGFESSVLYDGPYTIWSGLTSIARKDDEYEKMLHYLSAHYDPPYISCPECKLFENVTVDATGIIQAIDRLAQIKSGRRPLGFGHMSGYDAELALESVANVTATPIDSAANPKK